ncbi:MAG: glycosyltransferase [Halanaerobiales bacterium]|nr:glycosyltransferase [Halanaerobiales bacterium]
MEKKICFYYRMFLYGGVEVAILNLAKKTYNKKFRSVKEAVKELQKKYDLYFVYSDNSDSDFLKELKHYGTIIKLGNEDSYFFDIIVWGGLYFQYRKVITQITANHYISWIHSIPYVYPNCLLEEAIFTEKIDEFVCVSKEVATQLKKVTGIKGIVIHNELDVEGIKKKATEYKVKRKSKLEIVFVGRISDEKGLYRVNELAEYFEKTKEDYHFTIVGKAYSPKMLDKYITLFEGKNVDFVGKKTNPYPYMVMADYVVMFSDFESWGLATTEAKILGTPVLITNYSSAYEQIEDDVNGLIFKMGKERVTRQLDDNPKNNIIITKERINKLIKNKQKYKDNLKDFEFKSEHKKWEKIFDSCREIIGGVTVYPIRNYYDLELKKLVIQDEPINVTPERSEELIKQNLVKKRKRV